MASSSAKERRHLQAVLSPLVNSMRGQIFLLNLSLAVKVIGAPKFKSAFMGVLARDAKRMHEDDYLPHLKGVLQKASSGLLLQCKVSSFPEFAPDRWLVNILPFVSFKTYYEDPAAALSGHIPFSSMPGNCVKRYKAGAATAPYWWVAGRTSFPSTSSVQSDAQGFSLRCLRWAYQAKVMKTFDRASSVTVCQSTGTCRPNRFTAGRCPGWRRLAARRRPSLGRE